MDRNHRHSNTLCSHKLGSIYIYISKTIYINMIIKNWALIIIIIIKYHIVMVISINQQ
jgi:hypothetical protein